MRILLVEDDPGVIGFVSRGLRDNAYAVDIAQNVRDALFHAFVNPYDLIVLDVMIPGGDGFDVCRRIRGRGVRTRILMLTARDAVEDRIRGLDAGADDYLTKPFDFGELLARLRAMLRRGERLLEETIRVGDMEVDTRAQRVARAGREVSLTTKEYALLEFLARHAGRVVGRAEISEHVWDDNFDPLSNSIEVYVNRLRRKLGEHGTTPLIHTRRGAGYLLEPASGYRMTIRLRLTLWYAAVMAVVLIAVGAGTYWLLSHALRERTDRSLVELVDAFTAVLADEEREHPGLDVFGVAHEAVSEFRYADRRVALFGMGQTLVAASEPPSSRQGPDAPPLPSTAVVRAGQTAGVRGFRTLAAGKDGTRVVTQPATISRQQFVAVAVGSLRDEAELRRTLGWMLLLMVPTALLLASGGGYLLARAALAPVEAMGREAAQIDARSLHARVSSPPAHDELGRLADAFNALLDRLESAFEQQRRFMADASHELRTPVAIVRGEADVALSKDRDTASLRESLRVVGEEGRRLSRIVEDLFTLARADAGQYTLVPSDVYLDELVEECLRAYQSLAADRGVRVSFRTPGEVSFRGDEALLRRMVLNLLDNAAKHTTHGGSVEVALTTAARHVRIHVTDTGTGIPAAAVPHVFERFYRADTARTRATGGAGLGLPIARWIAESHQGSLEIAGTGPLGTTFVISLPLDPVPAPNRPL